MTTSTPIADQLEELLKHPVNRARFYDVWDRTVLRNWKEQAGTGIADVLIPAIAAVERQKEQTATENLRPQ